jgi:CRISPR/Cas system-associated endoribonuclease Cas2
MKGNLTRNLLEAIENRDVTTTDLLGAFLSAGYGASRNRIEYIARQNQRARNRKQKEWDAYRRYCNLIYRLRRDGLVQTSTSNKKKTISITEKGRFKLALIRERNIPKFSETVATKEHYKTCVVIFDIPEKEKSKRDLLRDALKKIGLHMLQKSVWIGKFNIPKELIDYLRRLQIIEYVQIFEVSRAGSLEDIQ